MEGKMAFKMSYFDLHWLLCHVFLSPSFSLIAYLSRVSDPFVSEPFVSDPFVSDPLFLLDRPSPVAVPHGTFSPGESTGGERTSPYPPGQRNLNPSPTTLKSSLRNSEAGGR